MKPFRDEIDLDSIVSVYAKEENLSEFLNSQITHLSKLHSEQIEIRAEILYLNTKQRLLEQIAQVGFSGTRNSMRLRPIPRSFDSDFVGAGICAYAVVKDESVLVPNVKFDKRYTRVQQNDTTESELAVPVRLGSEVIGVLNLESDTARAFGNRHLEYFELLSPVLALMVHYDTNRREEAFHSDCLSAMSKLTDRRKILEIMLLKIQDFLGPEYGGCVAIPVRRGEELLRAHEKVFSVEAAHNVPLAGGEVLTPSSSEVIAEALCDEKNFAYRSSLFAEEDALSEFAALMKSGVELVAIIYLRSTLSAISERYQRAIMRLADSTAAILFGLEQRRQEGAKSVLDAVENELHNVRGMWGLLANDLRGSADVKERTKRLGISIQKRLNDMDTIVSGFQGMDKDVDLKSILLYAQDVANEVGVNLSIRVDTDALINGTETGFKWLFENLILNSANHGGRGSESKACLEGKFIDGSAQLVYWDNGRAPENLAGFLNGKKGRRGVRLVKALCDRYGWEVRVDKHHEGGLLYEFKFQYSTNSSSD